MAKRTFNSIDPRLITHSINTEGTLEVNVPISSKENGTEGTLTMTLTADMGLRFLWDGVGLSAFEAWSTQ